MAFKEKKKGDLGRRRSLKGGVVKRSTSVGRLRALGIREINPFRSTTKGA